MPSTESLSQLFGEHHRRVLLAAYRITGSMADAEDVTQAVFLRLASVERPMGNVGSYLYRAAINGALDLLRRRKAAPTEPLDHAANIASAGPGSSPEAEASGRQLGEALRLAISELPPKAAEMFTLRYLEDLGNREIAALMGTSQAVVAVTLHNARSRLRKRITEMGGQIK
jgi:RNA polymerase sigma factor (sigma-70 family)